MKKLIIKGCDARGDGHLPYLTRWVLLQRSEMFAIYLHKFHRSDNDDWHDHPWSFISIVLWRGYREEILKDGFLHKIKRIWPGMIIYRNCRHAHRVVLINEKPAYTIVIRFKTRRFWGFWRAGKWEIFKDYLLKNGCNYEETGGVKK